MGLFSFSSVTVMGLNSKSQIASISVCLPSLVKSILFHMALELCEVIQFLVLNVFLPLASSIQQTVNQHPLGAKHRADFCG